MYAELKFDNDRIVLIFGRIVQSPRLIPRIILSINFLIVEFMDNSIYKTLIF